MGETLYLHQDDKNHRILTDKDYGDLVSRINYLTSQVQVIQTGQLPGISDKVCKLSGLIWECASTATTYVRGVGKLILATGTPGSEVPVIKLDEVSGQSILESCNLSIKAASITANSCSNLSIKAKNITANYTEANFTGSTWFHGSNLRFEGEVFHVETSSSVNIMNDSSVSIRSRWVDIKGTDYAKIRGDYVEVAGVTDTKFGYRTNIDYEPNAILQSRPKCDSSPVYVGLEDKWPFLTDSGLTDVQQCLSGLYACLNGEIDARKNLIDLQCNGTTKVTRIKKNSVLEVVDNIETPTETVLSAGKIGGSSTEAVQVQRFLVSSSANTTGMLVDETGFSVSLPAVSIAVTSAEEGVGSTQPVIHAALLEGNAAGSNLTIGDTCPNSTLEFKGFNTVTVAAQNKWPFESTALFQSFLTSCFHVFKGCVDVIRGDVQDLQLFKETHFVEDPTGFWMVGSNKPVYISQDNSAGVSINNRPNGAYIAINNNNIGLNSATVLAGNCSLSYSDAVSDTAKAESKLRVENNADPSGIYLQGPSLTMKFCESGTIDIAYPEFYPWSTGGGLTPEQSDYLSALQANVIVKDCGVMSIAGAPTMNITGDTMTLTAKNINLRASNSLTSNHALSITTSE